MTADIKDELWQKKFLRKEDIVVRNIADETVLVPIRGELADMQRIFSLNTLGALIWNMLDGRSLGEIRDHILSCREVEKDALDADIREFMAELSEADLITGTE